MLLRAALARGLTVADFNEMSVGMVVDLLVDWQNAEAGNKQNEARRATPADYAAF